MREMPKTTRTSYSGVIDADGHINEPHDLWERYIDPPFRDRAIRMGTDPDGCGAATMRSCGTAHRRSSTLRSISATANATSR